MSLLFPPIKGIHLEILVFSSPSVTLGSCLDIDLKLKCFPTYSVFGSLPPVLSQLPCYSHPFWLLYITALLLVFIYVPVFNCIIILYIVVPMKNIFFCSILVHLFMYFLDWIECFPPHLFYIKWYFDSNYQTWT